MSHATWQKIFLGVAMCCIVATPLYASPVLNPGNGHSYDVIIETNTWLDAKASAEAMTFQGCGGHLVTITSAAEQQFLENTFGASFAGAWAGGFQDPETSPSADDWHWITGEAWSYTNWAPGEPNDNGGPEMWLEIKGGANFGWNDLGPGDGTRSKYVIEFDCPPVGDGKVVQTGCDTLSLDPDSVRVKITFGVINLGNIPICSVHLTPIQSGSTPADSCRILETADPPGWTSMVDPGTGSAWWHVLPGAACIDKGGKHEPFMAILDPLFCCYKVEFDDENGNIFFTDTVCFECEKPVQTIERSWGSIKSQYR